MYEAFIDLLINFKKYINYFFYGDNDKIQLNIIYEENDINISNIYKLLNKINKVIAKETDYNKILNFINREIKYENDSSYYEKILDLQVETPDLVIRIELLTKLNHLKKSFEKIIYIRDEYYKNINIKNKNI
jgi:hypothetical protein